MSLEGIRGLKSINVHDLVNIMAIDETISNNRLIVKNTIFLYIRMVFVLLINLYLSRVVLRTLGVVDYGIYNIVGSVVVLFSYVNSALSVATVRFFSYEMHKGLEKLNVVFNTSVKVQLILSFILVLLLETIGLWLVNRKLVIPIDRMVVANWVYQFSVITSIITIMRVPYESTIISYEHMHMFAIFSIAEVILKFILILLMIQVACDQLLIYSLILLLVAAIGFLLRYVYCKKKYKEVRIKKGFDKTVFRKMLSFVGWNFFGATAGMSVSQGLNFIMNLFFGPVVNAARGIAIQIESAVAQFATSINTAINPQIIKRYSVGDNNGAFSLAFFSTKMVFVLLSVISVPIIFNVDYALRLWLGNPPEGSDVFTQLELVYMLTLSLTYSINMCAQASGKIKIFQIVESSILLLNIPATLILYNRGMPPFSAFVTLVVVSILALFAKLLVINRQIAFPMTAYVKVVILPIAIVSLIFGALYYARISYISEISSLYQFIAHTLILWVILIPTAWLIILDVVERKLILNFIRRVITKYKKNG